MSWTRSTVVVVVLTLVIGTLYYGVLEAYWFEDDFQWLVGSLRFEPSTLFRLEGRDHFFRPVPELYFGLVTKVCGPSASCYHLLNVLLHGLTTLLVFGLVWRIRRSFVEALLAALLFACQPGSAATVSWVSSVTQLLSAFFYLSAILLHMDRRRAAATVAATLSFLSHESAVTLPLVLVLTDWVTKTRREQAIKDYLPYASAWAVLLGISFIVNQSNYVVTEGHYAAGWHPFTKLLEYIMVLYVGPRATLAYIFVTLGLVVLLVKGSRRVRFYTLWMLVTLLPFTFFTWGIAPRYVYLATVGFAGLLAEAVFWIAGLSQTRARSRGRLAVAVALALFLVARSASFTSKRIRSFVDSTVVYRDFVESVVEAGVRDEVEVSLIPDNIQRQYVGPALRWVYQNPDLVITMPPP